LQQLEKTGRATELGPVFSEPPVAVLAQPDWSGPGFFILGNLKKLEKTGCNWLQPVFSLVNVIGKFILFTSYIHTKKHIVVVI